MRTYKKVYKNAEDKVYCDICSSLCTTENFGSEYATLEAFWGYASKSDGKRFDIQICEPCFYEMLSWMRSKRSAAGLPDDPDSPLKGRD